MPVVEMESVSNKGCELCGLFSLVLSNVVFFLLPVQGLNALKRLSKETHWLENLCFVRIHIIPSPCSYSTNLLSMNRSFRFFNKGNLRIQIFKVQFLR